MQKESFYSILAADEKAEGGGLGRWFWMLAFLTLEILLIRWIMQMQQEAARRAREVDQARREAAKYESKVLIKERARPAPEPKEGLDAPIQAAALPLPEPQEEQQSRPDKEIKASKMDDFRRLEGIGPKVNALLHEAEMRTFSDLAESSEERLREILREANLYMLNPETWPEQAKLAAKGDWESLERLKNRLKGGR